MTAPPIIRSSSEQHDHRRSSSASDERSLASFDLQEHHSQQKRDSISSLQESLSDIIQRRRSSSIDTSEPKTAQRQVQVPSSNQRPPRLPPSPSIQSADNKEDMMMNNNDESANLSEEWGDESNSSLLLMNTDPEPPKNNSSRRGSNNALLRGLSKRFNRSFVDSQSINNSNTTTDWNDEADQGAQNDFSCAGETLRSSTSASSGSTTNSNNSHNHNKPFFLANKVGDSMRSARINRQEAKRTALEESLMKQLAHLQGLQETELEESTLKLQQREAAIQTLETALSLQTETLDRLRDELDETRQKLKAAELKLEKVERKERKQNAKQQKQRGRTQSPADAAVRLLMNSSSTNSSARRKASKRNVFATALSESLSSLDVENLNDSAPSSVEQLPSLQQQQQQPPTPRDTGSASRSNGRSDQKATSPTTTIDGSSLRKEASSASPEVVLDGGSKSNCEKMGNNSRASFSRREGGVTNDRRRNRSRDSTSNMEEHFEKIGNSARANNGGGASGTRRERDANDRRRTLSRDSLDERNQQQADAVLGAGNGRNDPRSRGASGEQSQDSSPIKDASLELDGGRRSSLEKLGCNDSRAANHGESRRERTVNDRRRTLSRDSMDEGNQPDNLGRRERNDQRSRGTISAEQSDNRSQIKVTNFESDGGKKNSLEKRGSESRVSGANRRERDANERRRTLSRDSIHEAKPPKQLVRLGSRDSIDAGQHPRLERRSSRDSVDELSSALLLEGGDHTPPRSRREDDNRASGHSPRLQSGEDRRPGRPIRGERLSPKPRSDMRRGDEERAEYREYMKDVDDDLRTEKRRERTGTSLDEQFEHDRKIAERERRKMGDRLCSRRSLIDPSDRTHVSSDSRAAQSCVEPRRRLREDARPSSTLRRRDDGRPSSAARTRRSSFNEERLK